MHRLYSMPKKSRISASSSGSLRICSLARSHKHIFIKMEIWWFSRIIAHHPYAIILTVFIFSTTCLIVPLATKKFPNFSDPQLGFEARGTILAQRLTTWQNLMETMRPNGELSDHPLEYYQYLQQLSQQSDVHNKSMTRQSNVKKKSRNRSREKGKKYKKLVNGTRKKDDVRRITDKWQALLKLSKKERSEDTGDYRIDDHSNSDAFFCNLPNSAYARVIIGTNEDERSLWSMEGVLAQCHIDAVLRANSHFSSLCQTQIQYNGIGDKCCRSWSPANYVALLSNRSSCLGVTESDLNRVEVLLKRCAYYYHNQKLTSNCAEDLNCQKQIPAECYVHNAVYHLLHYLLDIEFTVIHNQESTNETNHILRSVMLFLPIAAGSASLDFYNELHTDRLNYGKFQVQGMQLGLKSTLFDRSLVTDSSMVLSGFAFVMLCIWVYTGSLLLTITTFFAVLFSLGISYALYTLAFHIQFFPFMNLLAIVVAVGIGADDAFIYCKVWEGGKQQKLPSGTLVQLVQETMKHALPSMFVTSLTTAVAFFASIVSNVTAINCFSLFSGITVIVNFFLMVTWLPACVIVSEHCHLTTLSPASFLTRKIIRPFRLFADKVAAGFSNHLTRVTIGLRWFWLMGLGIVAAAGCTIVFEYPGLQLPDSPDFQLFDGSHPFEQYDLLYSKRFWFEKLEMLGRGEVFPLRFVWGVKPVDNGDYLNPDTRGTPEWDESFDMSDPSSQIWLRQFCRNLRTQPFYRSTMGPLLHNCFIETLYSWMQRRCEDPINSEINYSPCCESSKFPYEPNTLRQCAAEASAELHRTPSYLWSQNNAVSAGLKFLKEPLQTLPQLINNSHIPLMPMLKIKALVIEYDSTYAYSLSFSNMDEFFHRVEAWMQNQLKTAPEGMRGGWFVSTLEFYELQRTLYDGTIWAISVSLALALTILALVTLNPLVSLYAILTIGAAIIVTVASLILLGWKLNVLESVAVSTAIGLAVDFSLHYAVSYRACASEERISKVKVALEQMGGPTLMASVTSGAAGAMMLPSRVLAYIQIGIFLLLVMGISWIYATLFLCPMLAILGPTSNFAQFQYPRLRTLFSCLRKSQATKTSEMERSNVKSKRKGKGRGMLSESTMSTSSTVCQFHCSELETLAMRPPPSPTSTLLQ